MINLAGDTRADVFCYDELHAAGIATEMLPAVPRAEVPARVTGKLGEITLSRAWYYWVAKGPVPLALAEKLYADPIGARDVRVAGHCGCPPPEEWTDDFDADGNPLCLDPDGSQEAQWDAVIKDFPDMADKRPRFVRAYDGTERRYVMTYHIDSSEGLELFSRMLREWQATQPA
jgi:hypothetical protein